MTNPLTHEDRLKKAYDILSSDFAFESSSVVSDVLAGVVVSQREKHLAEIVIKLYKIIHPAFGCEHPEWDQESNLEDVKVCDSIDCQKNKSVCCGAKSLTSMSDEGTGCYVCSNCKKEYVGGKCDVDKL